MITAIRSKRVPWRGLLATVAVAVAAAAAVPAAAQAASPAWEVLSVTRPTNLPTSPNERQLLTLPNFDIYTLSFGGDTTGSLSTFSGTAADIESELNALPSISAGGGSVTVTDGPTASSYLITFDGGLLAGTDVPLVVYNTGFGSDGSVTPAQSGTVSVYAFNVGGADTSGAYTVELTLPPGLSTVGSPTSGSSQASDSPWDCGATVAGESSATCTRSTAVHAGSSAPAINIPVTVSVGTSGETEAETAISGGGAAVDGEYQQPITITDTPASHGVQAFFAGAYDEDGSPETRAGAHPFTAMAAFLMNTTLNKRGEVGPAKATKQVNVDLPLGFVANPMIAPRCPRAHWYCGGDSLVGLAGYEINDAGQSFQRSGLANVLPPRGAPAQVTFATIATKATVIAKLRPDDYGVTSIASNVTTDYPFFGSFVTLWGQPGHPVRDQQRCVVHRVAADGCDEGPAPGGVTDAFVTNPTTCTEQPVTTLIGTFAWQDPDVFVGPVGSDSPPVTDCEDVPFEPAVSVVPSSSGPDSASGIKFDLDVPQDGLLDPDGIATSHLKDAEVVLPEGLSVNPSAATGLEACSDAQMQKGSDAPPACPDGSKLGVVRLSSPLVDREIGGTMYLGTPKSTDPQSGEMLRLWVVARNDELGVMVKLPGSATADPATGKLVATFENNPQLPFDHLEVELKGGPRGVLATPQTCGPRAVSTTLTPWSGTVPVSQNTSTNYQGDCSLGFAPALSAGMDTQAARSHGTFGFRFSRRDGEQWLRGLTARLPQGLLASVKDLPLCSNAQANAGACPAGSRIGLVDAKAGSGDPFVLERKGEVFLTEGYKGGAYGLAVKIRPVAGPFRGAMELSPIIVRQAIHVDRKTAQVTAVSDPFPLIHHGIPLRVREVTVLVDRANFMLSPSDCSPKQVQATILSAQGTRADVANHFQAANCADLRFKPRLRLALKGRRQVRTGKHPGVRAQVTQKGIGEAGIEQAVVRLPKTLALDPDNAQALCEFADGTKDDLENHCPKGSIVGRARAVSPLLNDPLVGNVYFVKNIRIDKKTGNEIRTLPMIMVALRGEIAINLKGESDTTRSGKLVNTFASVPDAPVSRFNLNIKGGSKGILAVTRTRKSLINLCAKPKGYVAEADMDGHNGKRYDRDVRMKTPCSKRQTKAAKRKAKRAASERAARRR